ncbi:hypothetical protein [Amycolatopsis sp. SID8362]|nr:hypothetical protein [Amycolatopsis sp. SID8362]
MLVPDLSELSFLSVASAREIRAAHAPGWVANLLAGRPWDGR